MDICNNNKRGEEQHVKYDEIFYLFFNLALKILLDAIDFFIEY